MSGSDARKFLAGLTSRFGADGILVVRTAGAGESADGAEPAPGDGLKWPPCRCGQAVCPDRGLDDEVTAPEGAETRSETGAVRRADALPDADRLRSRLAERNRYSSRGGL
ncbi:hypothetical protein [Streptomyces sp. NBC_01497]|uniref:hypothetical protein n=1 Tax=Streptomyces sp. NBC_01497 TaxID=2903885 RepID=UPI002E3160A8|nr:hypothetical protein [Streptomyces sp. NBC_01497]